MAPVRTACLALIAAIVAATSAVACGGSTMSPTNPTGASGPGTIQTDSQLFQLVTQTDVFSRYTVFPNAEEFTTGRLIGSEAHRPVIRVSLNVTAARALQDGRLANGARFPDGSIVFKEIRPSAAGATSVYVVMVKDSASSLAGQGWLWGEYAPDGRTVYSVTNRGGACTGCHLLERGPQNDLVRTFERQR